MTPVETNEILRLFKCCIDTGTAVLREFGSNRLLSKHGGSFERYIEDNMHYFYHQWDKKRTACCLCSLYGCSIPKSNKMSTIMFNMFYDDKGAVDPNHVVNMKGCVTQICLHQYTCNQNTKFTMLDISALHFLLCNTGSLSLAEKTSVDTINSVRNAICHTWSTTCHPSGKLNDLWNDLETAILNLTSPYLQQLISSQILSLKKVDFDKDEVKELSQQLRQIITDFEENAITQTNRNDAIINRIDAVDGKLDSVEKNQVVTSKVQAELLHKVDSILFAVKYDKPKDTFIPQGTEDCPVLWHVATPEGWKIDDLEATGTINDETFKVKFIRKGSLVMLTTIPANILHDQNKFEAAIKSFLSKLVEELEVDTTRSCCVNVRLHVLGKTEVAIGYDSPIKRQTSDKGVQVKTQTESKAVQTSTEKALGQPLSIIPDVETDKVAIGSPIKLQTSDKGVKVKIQSYSDAVKVLDQPLSDIPEVETDKVRMGESELQKKEFEPEEKGSGRLASSLRTIYEPRRITYELLMKNPRRTTYEPRRTTYERESSRRTTYEIQMKEDEIRKKESELLMRKPEHCRTISGPLRTTYELQIVEPSWIMISAPWRISATWRMISVAWRMISAPWRMISAAWRMIFADEGRLKPEQGI